MDRVRFHDARASQQQHDSCSTRSCSDAGVLFTCISYLWENSQVPLSVPGAERGPAVPFSVDGPDASVRIRPLAGAPSRSQRARASRGRAQVPRGAFAAPPSPFRPTT